MKLYPFIIAVILLFVATFVQAAGVIKIGVPEKLTGPYASDGKTVADVIKFAVFEINDSGGLLGRQVEIVMYDIEDMTAEKIIAAAEELIVHRKVDMLISGYAGMGPDVEYFGKYDVPYFHYDSVTSCVEMVKQDPERWNVFMLGSADTEFGRTTFDNLSWYPYSLPNKAIAFVVADFEWERKFSAGIKTRALEKGWVVASDEIFPYGNTQWGPTISKLRSSKPAIICFHSLYMDDSATFFKEFLKNPVNSLVFTGYAMTMPGYPELVGNKGNGLVGMSTTSRIRTQACRDWVARFQALFGYPPPATITAQIYDGVKLWAAAVEAIGDEKAYRKICHYIENTPYEGISGRFKFEPGHYVKNSQEFPMTVLQIQNGKVVELYWNEVKAPGAAYQKPHWMQ
jgi:ABC-type branched-subunit amino acid transport system substrate-binding protein